MISFCLKSLDKNVINDLEHSIENINMPDILYSQKKFKISHALIIHYIGTKKQVFTDIFSSAISSYIIENYEKKIANSILKFDYFYFDKMERNKICCTALKNLNAPCNALEKNLILQKSITDFHLSKKKYNIDGFINFRLQDYKKLISKAIEEEVNNYVIQKEYIEYVALLKEYITYQSPQNKTVHLFYSSNEKFLLDELGKLITTTSSKKYLSDISFSTNDFLLNSILALMPEELIIHLHCSEDNFIIFLNSIFEDRCKICYGCTICT